MLRDRKNLDQDNGIVSFWGNFVDGTGFGSKVINLNSYPMSQIAKV